MGQKGLNFRQIHDLFYAASIPLGDFFEKGQNLSQAVFTQF